MKKNIQRILPTLLGMALVLAPLGRAAAEDVDLFVSSATNTTSNPNILIVVDNSANWSAANQHWPNNVKQGESELRAIRTLVNELGDTVNVGLMMMTGGTGSNANGGYVRFHVRQMTTTNKAALRELIGDSSCVNGSNSLNGTPNCIFNNFDSSTEKIGTSSADYSRTLFEVFKYFGGYTSPAHANDDVAGTPIDTSAGSGATHFGAVRYGGNPDSKSDPSAFVNGASGSRTTYNSPLSATNSCAKNYVIFIGNGFASGDDTNGAILSNVGGTTTQLAMPVYSTTTATRTDSLTLSDNTTACRTQTACQTALSTAYGTAYSSYACATNTTGYTTSGCTGQAAKGWTLSGTGTFTTTTATGALQVPATNKTRYADEWAKFLYTTDVSSATGRQFVYTYTIDVFKDQPDGDQNSLLSSMAKYGGGKYFQASSEDAILAALRQTVIEIQSVNSVFASASLPINATNRSQNENQVFIGMFRPDSQARPRWYGNLKRYQVGLFSGSPALADKNGLEAISRSTGFIQPCATSFWTTDSGTYWDFAGSSGTCTTSTFDKLSDSPDGPLVEKGATAEIVRKGNNPPTTDTSPTYAVNRSVYTCPDSVSCNCTSGTGPCVATTSGLQAFNTTNVSTTRLGVSTTTEQTAIVNFGLGKDVDAENSVSASGDATADVRGSVHGDVAHSRPLPVNYGGSTGVVLFYGANDGTFRAVRGNDGKELWAFIAPEHHSKLKRLRDNSPIISYPGVSASLSPTPKAKDYFFDGSAGFYETFNSDNTANTVWVFPTMRRGGRTLYAFDVSNVSTPVMKWRIGCPNLTNDTDCTTDYTQIGQTWSIPSVGRIKGFSTTTPIIVMGGGYDSCEDTDASAPSCGSTKGNRIYVINADTGAKLAELATDRSVPADVTLIDRDFDGFVDHAYAADTGGNVYRVDFVDPTNVATTRAASEWTITKIARTTGAGRKFLFGPAALPSSNRIYLTLTSGDRERPLINNYPYVETVQNRAYMVIDKFATSGLPVNLDGSTMANMSSGSDCSTALTSVQDGWFFNLEGGRGEQGVTSSIIFAGLVFFSTNRPLSGSLAACSNNLGEARGYAVNLLNGSGAVGTAAICGGTSRSNVFTGGGLPPSPVTGTVPIGDKLYTIMIGGVDRAGGDGSSPLQPHPEKPVIAQKRTRIYWYKKGDQ